MAMQIADMMPHNRIEKCRYSDSRYSKNTGEKGLIMPLIIEKLPKYMPLFSAGAILPIMEDMAGDMVFSPKVRKIMSMSSM